MDAIKNVLKNKKPNLEKLCAYGFAKVADGYAYVTTLQGSGFEMTVSIAENGEASASLKDPVTDELYVLHLVEGAAGAFVGEVKAQYEAVLADIAAKCFAPDVFKAKQTHELIAYVREAYGDEPEYLWQKFPDNAVWRRKDTKKWYGALLTTSRRKLGLDSDEQVEILDLRMTADKMSALIDNMRYFPGWHMNKKTWYTIILDGSVSTEEICQRIDFSYQLAVK